MTWLMWCLSHFSVVSCSVLPQINNDPKHASKSWFGLSRITLSFWGGRPKVLTSAPSKNMWTELRNSGRVPEKPTRLIEASAKWSNIQADDLWWKPKVSSRWKLLRNIRFQHLLCSGVSMSFLFFLSCVNVCMSILICKDQSLLKTHYL